MGRRHEQTDQMGIGTTTLASLDGTVLATIQTSSVTSNGKTLYTEVWTALSPSGTLHLPGQCASRLSTQATDRAVEVSSGKTATMVFCYDPLPTAAEVAAMVDPPATTTVLNRRLFNSLTALRSGDSAQVTGWLHRELASDGTVHDAWVLTTAYGLPEKDGDARYFSSEIPTSENWPSTRAFYAEMLRRGLASSGRSVRVKWKLG